MLRVRWAALLTGLMTSLLCRAAAAECQPPEGCVDPEPLWLTPSSGHFQAISSPEALAASRLQLGASLGFRLQPAVLTVPSPNRDGRDVNVVSHATDLSLAARLGVGHGLELTLIAPAGLYQRGAGIKGVTSQDGGTIPAQALHDFRLGFGFALPQGPRWLTTKLRFEAKLPVGAVSATEAGPVASPSVALQAERGGFFGGGELGLRLRQPSELFGLRVGSQAAVALGVGYQLDAPRLSFTLEAYALPSLITHGSTSAEWLAAVAFSPRRLRGFSLGVAGGSGLPLSEDAAGTHLAYGVPTLRSLIFAHLTPP